MKGALAAPFVFLGLAVAAWGSSYASPAIWSVALALLGGAWVLSGRKAPGVTLLAMALCAYVSWTIANTLVFSTAYNAAGLFDPMFLLIGFCVGRSLEQKDRQLVIALSAAGAAALSVWAVAQLAAGSARGAALFQTPNTLASVL